MAWICKEVKTGACDGCYVDKAVAQEMIEYHTSQWPGSKWYLVESGEDNLIGSSWHRTPEMTEALAREYGK